MKLTIVYTLTLLLLSSLAIAQCSNGGSGTTCMGPLTISPPSGNTIQSSIIFVDIGQPAPAPAATSYILSIVNGSIQESDNNGGYHSLVGPAGVPGQAATITIGSTTTIPPGSAAAVTNTGSNQAAVFNFAIPTGATGIQGPPGVVVGTVLSGTLTCLKSKGSVPAGFSSSCSFSVTGIK